MTTTLDFALKENFQLIAGDKWNVLTVLIVHTNRRNRCWPSSKTIARLATNGNPNRAVAARKWLLKHGAMELVPYDKRFGDEETKLPKRQYIYELTGKIHHCDDPDCCSKADWNITYLHLNPVSTKEDKPDEVIASHNFNTDEVIASHNYDGHNQSISSIEVVKDSVPEVTEKKPRPRNPLFDAVAQHIFEIDPAQFADYDFEEDNAGTRIGMIVSWLGKKKDSMRRGKSKILLGYISAPATPDHVRLFAASYKATSKASLPLDIEKFVDAWRKWATTRNHQPTSRLIPENTQPAETPEQAAKRRAELAEAMKRDQPAWRAAQ